MLLEGFPCGRQLILHLLKVSHLLRGLILGLGSSTCWGDTCNQQYPGRPVLSQPTEPVAGILAMLSPDMS